MRPVLVAEIEYEGFTADGLLRQAAFKALREDNPARDVETLEPAPATTDLKEPAPAITRSHGLRASGSAVVMDVALSHPDDPAKYTI